MYFLEAKYRQIAGPLFIFSRIIVKYSTIIYLCKMEEKTLQDYLHVPISEFRDVLNQKKETDFGIDIVRIRQAADELADELEDDKDTLYNSLSVAVTRTLPCLMPGHIFLNGVRIPIHAKMVSKRIAKMWMNRESKEKIKIEWETLLEKNRIKL